MVHVSKKQLSKNVESELFSHFGELFVGLSKQEATPLLNSLLSPAEQMMLAKRLSIILMLTRDNSTYKIAKTLNVSDSTVRSLKKQYKEREFTALLTRLTKQSNFDEEKFWQTLEKLSRLGMPEQGSGRWKSLKR